MAYNNFRNCTPFNKCITKIDETAIDDSEKLDLVMSRYNLLEYSSVSLTRHAVYGFIL